MKQIINRGSFLTLMFLLLGCLSLYAADNDLITRQITIKLEKAGTLPDRIASSRKYKITNLKIIGEINGTDLRMIREMAGSNSKGDYTDGKLSVLDLSEAKIVGGGDYYYCYNVYDYKYCHTSNDAIDSYAFYGCRRLTSLTLPAGITGIGYQAFWYCSGLTSLTLPAGIGWIGDNAFNGCSGLKEVRFCINDNLDTYLTKGHPFIGVNCDIKYYINDKEITSIEIPSNVTTLGNYVFQGCSGLTSLTLPDGITSIGSNAFRGCSGLTSLTLPDGITSIGHDAFYGCSGLTSLTLPDGITSIGSNAFQGCSGLTSLILPAGITEIGGSAFQGCSGLTSLILPAGITEIGGSAFKGCSGLTSIYVSAEKVPKIGSNVFVGVGAKKCTLYVPMGTYSDYLLSDFGNYFENIVELEATCIQLEKAGTLPDRIASSKKYHIANLKIIGEINGTDLWMIREMAGRDARGYPTDGKLSVLDLSEAKIVEGGGYYYDGNYNDYYTSNDVIGSYAFQGCSGLTSLNLPAGITSIGSYAFQGCSGLTSLTLPDGITWIGDDAFRDCSGLTSLNLPDGITRIGDDAFRDCSGLTSLNLPAGITEIGSYAFKGCSGLTSLILPAGITKIGSYAFQGCSGLTSLNLPDGITWIGDDAFRDCSGLTSLNLPDGITSIGSYAFYHCSGLTSLNLPAGITKIGFGAFEGCSGLTSLNLPAGITRIGDDAFRDCSGLTSLNLHDGITSIGDRAFKGCSGLTSLNLPDGITEIGGYAFQGCSGLTSIYVYAEKVPKIGGNVFEGIDAEKCTLYVPMGTYDDYRLSYIGSFFKYILEFDATGIDKITINLKKAGTLPDRIAINKKYEITNLKIIGEINGTDLRMIREMARSKLSVLDLSEAKIVEGGGCYYNNYYTSNDVIGPSTFEDCSGLTSLTLPAGITEIGDFAFWGCSGLTSLTLPAGITSIGYDAFYGCSGLTSLTLPDGITEIGIYAFKGCSGLTSLTLPDGITWIGHDAFKGCSGLTSIYVYAEKVPGYSNVFEGVDAKKCTLYVPMGTRDDYLHSLFGTYFENIVEFDATGIDKTTISTDVEEVARYSVNGQRLSAPTKGLNIVKYSDGSVKKVAVQ